MNYGYDIGNYELVIKINKGSCRSMRVMEKIKFIKDGENHDVGIFSIGDEKEVSKKVADILVKRDKVAEIIKFKKEVKEDGGK